MTVLGYMARNQYGETVHNLQRPRRDLLRHCDRKRAAKMYMDTKDGQAKHIGYVIAGQWWTVYTVVEWQGKA